MVRNLLLLIFLGMGFITNAQLYDNCAEALFIPSPSNYCSEIEEFTNVGNTLSMMPESPGCFTGTSGDVWFRFNPVATDVTILVNGASGPGNGGTLQLPQVALYYRTCGRTTIDILGCERDEGNNLTELYQGGLILGDEYYIRVSGANGNSGSFQLCITNYFAPKLPGSDCSSAILLCDQSSFTIESVEGAGFDRSELDDAPCFQQGVGGSGFETNSSWFKWVCETSGEFTFVLTPTNPTDDLDFVLFEMGNGIDDCGNKSIIRCMAAGEAPENFPTPCHGPTGLSASVTDVSESPGCILGQDNFIAAVQLEAGKAYALAVNNYTSTGNGFELEFDGTSDFVGPEVDFMIDPTSGLKCEETFSVTDNTSFDFGSIDEYNWFFGVDAAPGTQSNIGPHDINYTSFGPKTISLQVVTDRGCIATATQDIYVEPCCEDLPDLDLMTLSTDLTCYGIPDGSIQLSGSGGTPEYKFAFEDGAFSIFPNFNDLDIGEYQVKIQDAKGCEDTAFVNIGQPEQILVDAGSDIESELGKYVELGATFTPSGLGVMGSWISTNGDSIRCLDPLCLNIEVRPPGPTDYIITVVDEDGCIGKDTVRAIVDIVRNISYPNVFSPNGDGINDFFNLFGGISAIQTYTLQVFDRWGGMVYEGLVPLNNQLQGWDGTFNGELLNPGVYTFQALVEFVDRETVPFTGTITLVR